MHLRFFTRNSVSFRLGLLVLALLIADVSTVAIAQNNSSTPPSPQRDPGTTPTSGSTPSAGTTPDPAPAPIAVDTSRPADADARIPRLMIETGAFNSAIRSVAFSPDNRFVFAAAGTDIRVWDVQSGDLVHTIRGFESKDSGTINSIAVDPAGDYLVIAVNTTQGGYLRTCSLEDLDTTEGYWGDPATALEQQEDLPGISLGARSCNALTFSADNKYLSFIATVMNVNEANQSVQQNLYMFFDWESDDLVDYADVPNIQTPQTGALQGVAGAFFGTDHHYVIPGIDGLFDVKAQQNVDASASPDLQWAALLSGRLDRHYDATDAKGAVYDGNLPRRVATYAFMAKRNGRDVYQCDVWSADSNKPTISYDKLNWAPTTVKLSRDANLVAVGDALGNVRVFSAASGKTLFRSRSNVKGLYAASLNPDGGILGLGNKPHSGAAWKLNDYADLSRGFDLRNRTFVDKPDGKFPRPKTDFAGLGMTTKSLRRGFSSFVRVQQNGGANYETQPLGKMLFSWNLAPGFEENEALLFRGAGGFLLADLVQSGSPKNRFGTTNQGFFVSRGSPENPSIATDINHTSDGKYITVGWTNGVAAIYEKSAFLPQPQAIIPFLGSPIDLTTIRINQLFDPTAAGDLKIGDDIKTVDGKPVAVFMQDFFTQSEKHRVGNRMTATVRRNGQLIDATFQLVKAPGGVYTPSTAQPILTFLHTDDDDWILYTPEGYYDASLGGHDLVGWKSNRGPDETASYFTARQLRKTLYRPDLIDGVIDAILAGKTEVNVATANQTNQLAGAPSPVIDLQGEDGLESILPPVLEIAGVPDSRQIDTETLKLTVQAASQNDLPVRSIIVLVNGRPASGTAPLPQRVAGGGMSIQQTIKLPVGANELAFYATNSAATSSPKVITVTRTNASQQEPEAVKPKLYVLSVGVSKYKNSDYDLAFAAKDAQAFASALKAQEGNFYRSVEMNVLTDEKADRSSIQDGMDWLLQSVTQHDIAAIFISGHGIFDSRRTYYFCSHEVDADRLRSTALPNTEIVRLAEELPCKVLFFADTCHSGGATGVKAVNRDPWTDLVAEEVGAVMFASSTPQEVSLESPEWGHGAFTRAFLDAMQQKSTDFNSDGYISITELDLSLSERVKDLTEGRQHPTTQKPPTIRNFNMAVSGKE